jgi:hypothetical protein
MSLNAKKPLVIVGYDGWMTDGPREVIKRLYSESKLAVSQSGNLLATLKILNINGSQSTEEPIPAAMDVVADAIEPSLTSDDVDNVQDESASLASISIASSLGSNKSTTRLTPKSPTALQHPDAEIIEWLKSVRVAQFQEKPQPCHHLRQAIESDEKYRKILPHIERARAEKGFPNNLPSGLNLFREPIVRDYEEEKELEWKRNNRVKDLKERIRKEVEEYRVKGTFPLKRFVWKDPVRDLRMELSLLRDKPQKTVSKILQIKRELMSPPPLPDDTAVTESSASPPTKEINKEIAPAFQSVAVDPRIINSESRSKVDDIGPHLSQPEAGNMAMISPPQSSPHSAIGFHFDSPTTSPQNATRTLYEKPTPLDIAIIYRIVSTFPVTELWVIPHVYSKLGKGRPWRFSKVDDDKYIAKMITAHLKFYTFADGILYDRNIKSICSSRYPLPSELTLDKFADTIAELTSALRPTNDHVKKIWKLAYSEILSLRYIGGRTFENYDQIQIARGCAPLSEEDRPKYQDDFIEYVTDRVKSTRGAWNIEAIKKTIDQKNTEEAELRDQITSARALA